MELRNMYESMNEKYKHEHKIITKCIFQGLTIAQIAKKLCCSQSTVSNRMNTLFEKYNAKTRFEFVLGVMGEIVRNNKLILKEHAYEIEDLKSKVDDLTTILTNIIVNKNNKESFEYWINEAQDKLL